MQHKVEDTFLVAVEDRAPAAAAAVVVGHEHRRASHHLDVGPAHFANEGRRHEPGRRLALGKRRV